MYPAAVEGAGAGPMELWTLELEHCPKMLSCLVWARGNTPVHSYHSVARPHFSSTCPHARSQQIYICIWTKHDFITF